MNDKKILKGGTEQRCKIEDFNLPNMNGQN